MPIPHAQVSGIVLQIALGAAIEIDRQAGIIRNIAVITAGATKPSAGGDPFYIDAITLQQVADAINASPTGVKSRLSHPEIDGVDDITCRLGYIRNARVAGDCVRADMYFHHAGDSHAITLMDIAAQDPASCGLSIVDQNPHLIPLENVPTGIVLRVDDLDAVDWVGAPAGNPAGMLSICQSSNLSQPESQKMQPNQKQLAYLISIGLAVDADVQAVADFIEKLTAIQQAQFDELGTAGTETQDPQDTSVDGSPAAGGGNAAGSSPPTGDQVASSVATASKPDQQAIIDNAVMLAQKTERQRVREIRQIARKCGYEEVWADTQIDAGADIDEVRRVALASLKREPDQMTTSRVTVGADLGRDGLQEAIQDAIMLRGGKQQFVRFGEDNRVCLSAEGRPEVRKAHERANHFRGYTLLEMGRRYLLMLGYQQAENLDRPALATLLMSRMKIQAALNGVYLAEATGDFPFLLADTMGKTLRAEYALAPHTWSQWCRKNTAPDFKDIKSIRLSEAADLEEVAEGDGYIFAKLTDSQEKYALTKYGKGIEFTWEMLINDDLSAFSRVPSLMARAAARNIERLAILVLTANANMSDGKALFSTSHVNLTTGALSVATLGAARAKLRSQKPLGSDDPLELTPRFLLVPETLATTAEQLVYSAHDPSKYNDAYNWANANKLQVISSARLDSDSITKWYLQASPDEIDTVEVSFLEGEEAPVVTEEDEFSADVRRVKVRQVAAAKAIDYRGMVRSSGV